MANIRLQSTKDPSVVIEGPAGTPFDPREWQPAGQATPAAAEGPGGGDLMNLLLRGSIPTSNELSGVRETLSMGDPALTGQPPNYQASMPMAGAMLGGLAGRATGVPRADLLGQMVGGGLGEVANQALGVTEPDIGQIALQAGAPAAARAVGALVSKGLQVLPKILPGGAVGLNEAGARQLEGLAGQMTPPVSSAQLAPVVDQFNVQVDVPKLKSAVDAMVNREMALSSGARDPVALRFAKGLQSKIGAQGGALDFQDLRQELQRFGEKTGESARQGGMVASKAAKQIFAAGQQDLEAAVANSNPAMPAVQALQAFNQAYRGEKAAEELASAMTDRGIITTRRDGLRQINPQKLLNVIEKDDFLRESFGPHDLEQIKAVAEALRNVPIMGPQSGQQFGAGQSVVRGGLGYLGGTVLGMDPHVTSALAIGAPWLVSKAMTTAPGRALVMRMIAEHPVLDGPALGMLASFVTSQTATPRTTATIPPGLNGR